MKQCLKIFTTTIIFSALLVSNFESFAVSNQTGISLYVGGFCNFNGICEATLGEDETNCPADCGCNNNGICETARGEDYLNCPLDCPAPPPPSDEGGALPIFDSIPPIIYNLLVSEITLNSAKIFWETNEYAFCQLFWGETQEYELETIVETGLHYKHTSKLINLLPATSYHFKISCRDAAKNESETTDQKFTTLTPPDITPPANVSNFEAIPGDEKVELKWENPPDLDFKAVKIIRSEKFYPQNPWEGEMVYNDKGTSFVDTGLKNGLTYYYTAFAYDYAGNYSSGAIILAIPFKEKPLPPPPVVPPPVIPPPPEIEEITLEDFDFWQEDEKLEITSQGLIEIKLEKPLTVSVDYEKVPEVLKTIMVTLEKQSGEMGEQAKFFSFLLRINKEKTKYLATLAPPEPGIYPLTISVLDYKNQNLKQMNGRLIIFGAEIPFLPLPWYEQNKIWLYLLLILLILAITGYLVRKYLKTQNPKDEYQNDVLNDKFQNPNVK